MAGGTPCKKRPSKLRCLPTFGCDSDGSARSVVATANIVVASSRPSRKQPAGVMAIRRLIILVSTKPARGGDGRRRSAPHMLR